MKVHYLYALNTTLLKYFYCGRTFDLFLYTTESSTDLLTLLSYPSLKRKLVTWKGNHSFIASATAPSVFVSAMFYRCISQKCQQNIWCKTQCSFALCYYFSCYEILLHSTNWLVEAMAYRLCTRGVNSLLNKTTLRLVHSQVSPWTRLSTIFLLLVFVHFIFVNWNWKLN